VGGSRGRHGPRWRWVRVRVRGLGPWMFVGPGREEMGSQRTGGGERGGAGAPPTGQGKMGGGPVTGGGGRGCAPG
jgi:hypothetical protein